MPATTNHSTRVVTPQGHGTGWTRDIPDQRDYRYSAAEHVMRNLPESVDLRPGLPAPLPFDQGNLGSCTSQAIVAVLLYDQMAQSESVTPLSRLQLYYNERAMEGTIRSDSGAQIRDGIKSVAQQGVCPESEWPYTISKFKRKPPVQCYTNALKYEALTYRRVTQTLPDMQGCLASGYPFVIGISVYASFESDTAATTGVIPMPAAGEQLLGGHALLCVGFDTTTQTFTVLGSWGLWGDKGFLYIPFDYLTSTALSGDFWMIQTIT